MRLSLRFANLKLWCSLQNMKALVYTKVGEITIQWISMVRSGPSIDVKL